MQRQAGKLKAINNLLVQVQFSLQFHFPNSLLIIIIFVSLRAFRTIMEHNVCVYHRAANSKQEQEENVRSCKLFIYHFSLFAFPAFVKVAIVIRHFVLVFSHPSPLSCCCSLDNYVEGKNSHKKIAAPENKNFSAPKRFPDFFQGN